MAADRIAEIEEHKVRTGESIKSLAQANGMTWQELAMFNWGTSVPDEINKRLHEEVGCTHMVDRHTYRFDDSDVPGIVFIPKKWSQSGLPTDQVHTIRVRMIERSPRRDESLEPPPQKNDANNLDDGNQDIA